MRRMLRRMLMLKRANGWGSWALVVAIFLMASGAQAAVPIVVSGELLGATGVNVGGIVYDVEIVEGTCVDLYDGCDDLSDFTFTALADAQLAGQAFFDQVLRDTGVGNFDTVPSLNVGCSGAFCGTAFPYGLPDATHVSLVSAINFVLEASDVVGDGPGERTFDSGADTGHDLTTYAIWTPVPPATQVVVGGLLRGATGVNVGGTFYDVQFVEGTCIDLYDGCDDLSDFTFTTLAGALLAAQALQDQVVLDSVEGNFDSVPNLTAGCSGSLCGLNFPYGLPDPDNADVAASVNQAAEPTDFFGPGVTLRTFDSGVDTFHALSTWAVWTLAGGDSDGDGVPDASDNCPSVANSGQDDTDSDGVGDACDICPGSDDNVDTDSDGAPDGCDLCPGFNDNFDADSDGVPDDCDICAGFDDNVDTDTDGVPDGCDVCPGGDDNVDTDADTVADFCDNCPNDANTPQADVDSDGVGDVCDICPGSDDTVDTDGDTVPDGCDVCPGFDDLVDSDGDTVPDGCDVCAPSAGTLIRMTIDGQVFSAPQFLEGIIDPGDPINFDVIVDTTQPNEATAPDFLVSDAGYLETFLILDVIGTIDSISVTQSTTRWSLRSTLDLTDALPGFYATLAMAVDNPANSGLVPVIPGNTYQIGAVNLEPTLQGRVFFNVLSATTVPEPNPSDDTVDTDGDAVPDDCDVCPNDNPDDTDSDGVCDSADLCPGADDNADADGDTVPDACDVCPAGDDNLDTDADGHADACDNCPADANPNQADADSDGIGNACDATPTAVPTLGEWGLLSLVILLISSSFITVERKRLV